MSGFFGSNESKSRWGGYLKQAISNVETTFDSLLEQPSTPQQQSEKDTETETYVDPISGMVTTVEKPKKTKIEQPKLEESRSTSDLPTRLAAVMAEKQKSTSAPSTPRAIEVKEEAMLEMDKDTVTTPDNSSKEKVTAKDAKDSPSSPGPVATVEQKETGLSKKNTTGSELNNVEEKSQIEPDVIIKNETNVVQPDDSQNTPGDKDAINTRQDSTTVIINSIPTLKENSDDINLILEQREKQLLQSMENIANLHDQMHQAQEEAEKREGELKSRIIALEKESESATSTANLTKNIKRLEATVEDLQKQIKTKDEKIEGLMLEGEKLSKIELKHSTTIKKLRQEKTEAEKNVADLTKKFEKATLDLSQASEKGTKQTETEKKLQESVKLLSDLTEQQTKHINKLESEKLINTKKYTETEASLKKTMDSIEEVKAKAQLEAEQVNAAALEKEIKANDRLHKDLTKIEEGSKLLEQKLRQDIRELQIALQTVEEQAGNREDGLRKDVADLQTKLQQSDNKMDDISTSVDEATAPLLRQIEELQTQHALAIKNRDQTEQSMILRMKNIDSDRKKASDNDIRLQQEIDSLNKRIKELEQELELAKMETANLKAEIESNVSSKKELERTIQSLISEKKELVEKESKDQEILKSQYQRLMRERLTEEKRQFELRLKAERASNASLSHIEVAVSPPSIKSSRSSFDSNSTATPVSSTILVERLQANIRQLENQLSFYQTQLQSSSQSRDELSDEVLNMSQETEELRKQLKKTLELERQHKDLNQRYQTLLELLGERTEEVQELKADLLDVKEMYKNQILELVSTREK